MAPKRRRLRVFGCVNFELSCWLRSGAVRIGRTHLGSGRIARRDAAAALGRERSTETARCSSCARSRQTVVLRYRGPESPPNLWNDDDGARDASILGRPVRLSHLVEGNAREDMNLHVAVGNRTEEIGSVLAERLRIGVVGGRPRDG